MTTIDVRAADALPTTLGRLGLGLGIDMPWGTRIGYHRGADGDDITAPVRQFLRRHIGDFSYLFFAFQPRDYGALAPARYTTAYDRLYAEIPDTVSRVFHHTMLNTGCPEPFDKIEVARFTNALIKRYGFRWIVEDLGIWSFRGKSLPYPLPPLFTRAGLEMCISHVSEWRRLLDAPISIEFPGFTEGGTFVLGRRHAFDFFTEVIERADVYATIDIGHILSYQWFRGRSGARAFDELDRLPLDRCIEFHLSGCQIVGGRFRDLHHGILLDEQLDLLEHLLPRCPNLVGVTYEDPVFDAAGVLVPKSIPNYLRLAEIVGRWSNGDQR
jgi:uncharacterized protein (UPF0276 family)